ncbi:PREDICTED: putative L-aspartate dehydrogenase [Amphimedon queenslandica]|uniref:Aspartate dehydrogenase domain-containing protein n=1 Tax=Amphimedon queenslandica TaxID=400682 RepID=A0A1X7V989_AMPQE|nr:PREDICTED: putative L-aspartate dehydrogenase [Amphimedon queenslandica]|eukprot:XP_003385230.1 PREDICTED: putative L-aspartate dehydrogenase [Amphimedon queenslandica]
MEKRRVGIVGFGSLGQYLYHALQDSKDEYEIAFVWNRSAEKMRGIVPPELILNDLKSCHSRSPHIIIEVAHPSISAEYGPLFLQSADFLIGSPTALADDEVMKRIKGACTGHALYVPVGALWGGHDIQRMADRGTLKGLKITMKKHPSMLKLAGSLHDKLQQVKDAPTLLYEGPVRDLCPLAPSNVNTMAAASIMAHNLGFDQVIGCLVADPSLNCHVIEVEVRGPGSLDNHFSVQTVRSNPAAPGAVTGKQTHISFLSSLLAAQSRGPGIHLC